MVKGVDIFNSLDDRRQPYQRSPAASNALKNNFTAVTPHLWASTETLPPERQGLGSSGPKWARAFCSLQTWPLKPLNQYLSSVDENLVDNATSLCHNSLNPCSLSFD